MGIRIRGRQLLSGCFFNCFRIRPSFHICSRERAIFWRSRAVITSNPVGLARSSISIASGYRGTLSPIHC
jgi:hypothetical protein